jgi:hypothetical protein
MIKELWSESSCSAIVLSTEYIHPDNVLCFVLSTLSHHKRTLLSLEPQVSRLKMVVHKKIKHEPVETILTAMSLSVVVLSG